MCDHSPRSRRKFVSSWDELLYVHGKVLYWLYGRQRRGAALRYSERFEGLLNECCASGEAIIGEECWALLCELKEDWQAAIGHRRREIALIEKLHLSIHGGGDQDVSDTISQLYDVSDLSDRMDLLACAYMKVGKLPEAESVLRQSKRLCEGNGIPFDGQDLLDDVTTALKGPSRPD